MAFHSSRDRLEYLISALESLNNQLDFRKPQDKDGLGVAAT